MPKLSFPKLTRGLAINHLVSLYRNHPPFKKELEEIKEPYKETIRIIVIDAWNNPPAIYENIRDYLQAVDDYINGKSNLCPFSAKFEKRAVQLIEYLDLLEKLAAKWKLNAPWAVSVLYNFDVLDVLQTRGTKENTGIPLEKMESISPWPSPVPPLKIEVSAWAFSMYSRDEIIDEIADRLKEFEGKIKETGVKEYPSSLEKHARWWFEHYILGKTYPEIEKEEEVLRETIKRKVWAFTKLIGIKVK